MTHVMNIFNSSLNSDCSNKYFSVEVITFDGESYTEEVEARTAEEAQELKIAEYLLNKANMRQIAASQYDNVDYTMVQGWFLA